MVDMMGCVHTTHACTHLHPRVAILMSDAINVIIIDAVASDCRGRKLAL